MAVLVVLLLSFVSCVLSQAPGDGDPLCVEPLINGNPNPFFPLHPTYPANERPLMDSRDYTGLLQRGNPPVWQHVDNDNNNTITEVTNWIQQALVTCRGTVLVCGFSIGAQENWLITQHISRELAGGQRLQKVTVRFDFQLNGCDVSRRCRQSFDVYKWQTSTINREAARNIGNYVRVGRVSPADTSGTVATSETLDIELTAESGFYMAVVDLSTCILIERILVFYYVCPAETSELITRPETISPESPVIGECVENSSPQTGLNPILRCADEGVWEVIIPCLCNAGYEAATEDAALIGCSECSVGTYSEGLGNEPCVVCPPNSEATQTGLTECTCVPVYYRAPDEGPSVACTRMCVFNNVTYEEGENFPAGDNCNECSCLDRGIVCSTNFCPEPCTDEEFQCPDDEYGSCYPLTNLCDSETDCSSGWDEQNCGTVDFTSPLEVSIEEGEVDTVEFCFTVTDLNDPYILRYILIQSLPGSAREELDYVFYNDALIFNGSYSVGDSECTTVRVSAPDDNLVEGTEVFNATVSPGTISKNFVSIFIIDNDYLRVGFERTLYSVSETSGELVIPVRVLADDNGITPEVGLPLGVRVTTRDGSAVAGRDFQHTLTTLHFRPNRSPLVVVRINILDDSEHEEEEAFTVELTAFDLSIVLVNSIAQVVIIDNDVATLTCSVLDDPTDGSVQYSSVDVGSVAEYTCNEGFLLEGATTRVCQTDGSWSGDTPTCRRVPVSEVCSVELVGSVAVNGNSATLVFRGVGSGITSFLCKVDGIIFPECLSPLQLTGLSSGVRRVRIVPEGCSTNEGSTFRFRI